MHCDEKPQACTQKVFRNKSNLSNHQKFQPGGKLLTIQNVMQNSSLLILKNNFFGVQLLYNVVLFAAVPQSESTICIYIYIPSSLDFLPIQVTKEHWVEFPVLYSRFSFVIYFIHSNIYVSFPGSPNSSLPLSLLVSIHLFSTSGSVFLCGKQVHPYNFSRFHIYLLIYIC